MKLSLVVVTTGKAEGKSIPVNVSKFLVGRDPDCQLRPASSLVSKRHCGIYVRGGKVFVEDFRSTNGTLVNNRMIEGEVQLQDKDLLKIGPLQFQVRLESGQPSVSKPTPLPANRRAGSAGDEEVAALLLSQDEGGPPPSAQVDSQGIPTGSTVFETGALPTPATNGATPIPGPPATVTQPDIKLDKIDEPSSSEKSAVKAAEKKPEKPKTGDTSVAAQAILEKYLRRPRTTEEKKK